MSLLPRTRATRAKEIGIRKAVSEPESEETMVEETHCPNCRTKLKGIVLSYSLLPKNEAEMANRILERTEGDYCTKCAPELIGKIRTVINEGKGNLKAELLEIVDSIPIATIQNPPKWEFEVKGIVTGQSTTETGIVSEFLSGLTDLFGEQSAIYNGKLANGERLCFYQLRSKAFALGANAVVGVDIDYSEVGGAKGMLMVCATGTAIKLRNADALFPDLQKGLDRHGYISGRLKLFGEFESRHFS